MTMERGGANSEKGREILARFLSDENFRAEVLANLREGRYGPGYSLEELSAAEREFLTSGRWRDLSAPQMQAQMASSELTWQ